jgi:DNA-binding MarR family transcriptional regulator
VSIVAKHPSQQAISAWARLVRAQRTLLAAVESELKSAGFPPLAWYDALLELSRTESGRLRPLELERAMLLPQYSTSRLIDRLVDAGLAAREACPDDGRGQIVAITPAGRALQNAMWTAYAVAIERHVGSKLSNEDAVALYELLGKLG